jgi:hypothetical protein
VIIIAHWYLTSPIQVNDFSNFNVLLKCHLVLTFQLPDICGNDKMHTHFVYQEVCRICRYLHICSRLSAVNFAGRNPATHINSVGSHIDNLGKVEF